MIALNGIIVTQEIDMGIGDVISWMVGFDCFTVEDLADTTGLTHTQASFAIYEAYKLGLIQATLPKMWERV